MSDVDLHLLFLSRFGSLKGFFFDALVPLDEPLKKQAKVVGNKCGELVYCQLPFIVGLAGKNNVISC